MKKTILLTSLVMGSALLLACTPEAAKAPKTEAAASGTPSTEAAPSLTASPQGTLAAGKAVALTLNLKDAAGAPLTAEKISVSHTQKVHVMIIDGGLEDYSHAHAEPGANPGEWTVSFTPKFARTYKVWTDFKLASDEAEHAAMDKKKGANEGHSHDGGHSHDMAGMDHGAAKENTPSATLVVGGEPAPSIATIQTLSAQAGGLDFSVSLNGAVSAGKSVTATLAVMDQATGKPFIGLEPIMGAYGHLVGFSADSSTMLHAHPSGEEPKDEAARGGPTLAFELEPGVAGPARLFLQVKKDGQVITVPFSLIVG